MAQNATALTRADQRAHFLADSEWAHFQCDALAADASFRQYFRLTSADESVLLMDAPPATEDIDAYIKIDEYLLSIGLRAPQILKLDAANGFAIIEDFGHNTYTQLLNKGESAQPLYQLAVDVLSHLHTNLDPKAIDVPRYDSGYYQDEADLLIDWYWLARTGSPISDELREEYRAIWASLLGELAPIDECLVLRDYHVDNLMVIEGNQGLASCGLLDFQDGLIGSTAYDMVSLFEDARRDVCQDMAAKIKADYLEGRDDAYVAAFNDWYAVLGAHRHVKVLGIFVRLCVRDHKDHYLDFVPHVQFMLKRSLEKPQLAKLKAFFDVHHPGAIEAPLSFDADAVRKLI